MDPKTTPPTQDDKLTGPNSAGGGTAEGRQVSVDIQGAPDAPVVDNDSQAPSTSPEFSDSAKMDPLPGADTVGPDVPSAADLPSNPMADEGMGGPAHGMPVSPGGVTPPAAGMPGATSDAAPASDQPATPPLFAHDAATPPVHTTAPQSHRMMLAAVGLLVIMVVAVVVAYVMSR